MRKKGNAGAPILYVHGAGLAGSTFDIQYPGASWMESSAMAGFSAYALDIRGYGRSVSKVMSTATKPYARAASAVKDIDDAIDWISKQHDGLKPSLVGMSWGSVTTALYASTSGADKITSLSLIAPIFAEHNQSWIDMLSDPENREALNPRLGAFRITTPDQVLARWNEDIPAGCDWRDANVSDAMIAAIMADDAESGNVNPPGFRAPNGTFVDLWECFTGKAMYDPARISVPVLLARGSHDSTSTRTDALRLFDHIKAEHRHYAEVANGSHFLIAERNAPQLFNATHSFINGVLTALKQSQ